MFLLIVFIIVDEFMDLKIMFVGKYGSMFNLLFIN